VIKLTNGILIFVYVCTWMRMKFMSDLRSHSGVAKDSDLAGCETVSQGEQRRIARSFRWRYHSRTKLRGTACPMTQHHTPGRTESSSTKFVFVYAEIFPSRFLECGLKTSQYTSQCMYHVL